MGSVRVGLQVGAWVLGGCASLLACTTEPALDRCHGFDASHVTERALVSRAETLIAIADKQADQLTYLRRTCGNGETVSAGCALALETVGGLHADAILLTGDGRWVTYVDEGRLHSVDMRDSSQKLNTGITVTSMVGALRSGSWVVFRFRAEYGLRAFNAATGLAIELDEGKHLLALALGDRSIIARERSSNGDRLYLAQINPAFPTEPDSNRAVMIPLGEAGYVDRVIITRGDTPSRLGLRNAIDPDVPLDEYVIVTSASERPVDGKRVPWLTQVFDAESGGLVTEFNGRVRSGTEPLVELPGLTAMAPDQRHLAYTAPGGVLALHDLETADSCRVRAANAREHDIAGFAGDGTLFFRSSADNERRVFAYDTATREVARLTGEREDQTLAAVPMRRALVDGQPTPWAITAGRGYRGAAAGGDDAVMLDGLPPSKTTFVPLDDTHVWTVNADDVDEGEGRLAIDLRRVEVHTGEDFDAQFVETMPNVRHEGTGEWAPFSFTFRRSRQVCVSISRVGEWLSDCTSPLNPTPFLHGQIPSSEL